LSATEVEQKRHGRHYTPERLATFLASCIVGNYEPSATPIRVLDPACGDGELLFAIDRELKRVSPQISTQLIGYDTDQMALDSARNRSKTSGVHLDLVHGDFLVESFQLENETFDLIITNPPYVRTQHLGSSTARLLAEQFGLTGRIDLTHPFVSIIPRLLKQGGVMGLLCSNRFLTTKAGKNVRAALRQHLPPIEIYDLGDSKLFSAAVLPAIVIAKPPSTIEPTPVCSYVSTYEVPDTGDEGIPPYFDALENQESATAQLDGKVFAISRGTLSSDSSDEPWRMGGTSAEEWLMGIRAATWREFGDIANIRVGVKTTADSVFIRSDWTGMNMETPENEILLNLLTHHSATAWKSGIASDASVKILYPYDLESCKRVVVNMDRYPNAMAYLEQNKARLEGRKYVLEGGRKWFEIWVPQKPCLWKHPKIVFPDISEFPRFSIDKSGAVVNGDLYWISLEDIGSESLMYLMLGVANSALAIRFYDHVCGNRLYSGRRRWISQYVSKFPLPDPSRETSRAIVDLVRKIVDSTDRPTKKDLSRLNELVSEAFTEPLVANETRDTLF
jgi:SAM-dependent methyltransferase